MAAAKMAGTNFNPTQRDLHFLGKGQRGGRLVRPHLPVIRPFMLYDVLPRVRGGDDRSHGKELGVSPAVILVVVRRENILDRLRRNRFDGCHQCVMGAIVFAIHQDDALTGDADGRVAAVAFNDVEIVSKLIDL